MSDDWSARLFPTTTRLNTFMPERGRVRAIGDKDTAKSWIEGELTDHSNSPLDGMSTLPKIFIFNEGLTFQSEPEPDLDPDKISNLTNGDDGSRRDNVNTFSHLRLSWTLVALPLITILNTKPLVPNIGNTKDEFRVTITRDREEVNGEKTREAQSPR
jgi:hypothetical protein